MRGLRYLWLLVPGLGVLELVLHLGFAARAPRLDEWRELAASVRERKHAGEPVVVAPAWAEPLARLAFGDTAFPLDELARAGDADVTRVLEVSALGARHPETRDWRVVNETEHGRFTLRVLENPAPVHPLYRFIEHVEPADLTVSLIRGSDRTPCEYTEHARVAAGGLHGEVAFPRQRFACGGLESTFVGLTVIDDQAYRPRRCIWAAPPPGGELELVFHGVPFGAALSGHAGLSYFLFRDSHAPPVTLIASSGGAPLGRYVHEDAWGWNGFRLATPGRAASSADVTLVVRAGEVPNRDFCFTLESVP